MISKIYHLADLHIRKGSILESRYDEYKQVFDNCINKIRETYIANESVCVICGDIFHHKLQISSNGIILFNDFVSSLAAFMKVFIVQGNHDLIQENDDNNNDLIKAMLSNKFSNVVYLDTTGAFQYENLNFGVVSIKDMLKHNTSSGLVDELPTFPEPKDNYFNIALSHCTVKNSYLHNYTKNTNGIPIEWFKGYNIAMLGDIHLQTTKYNKANDLYYGYPGSLIQQDFGESLFNHGFLEWNISENITVNKHHVHNKTGKVNIKLSDDNQLLINANNYIPFNEFLKLSGIPEFLHIRLYIKSNIDDTICYIRSELQNINTSCRIDVIHSHFLTEHSITKTDEKNGIDISELNSTNTIIEFFKKYENEQLYERNSDWKLLFSNYEKFLIPESKDLADIISEKIRQKNEKLRKYTDTLVNTKSKDINKLNIKELQFDWILSFGNGNTFVFDKDRIILINAPNGYGKSAFLECITIALFGESIPSRHNKHTSISIINKSKPYNCDTSNTRLVFSLNNKEYKLIRVFYELKDSKNKEVKRLFAKNVELYENEILIKSGATVVNKWISSNICSIDDFLLSSMISQNFDQDFFKFKPQDQMNTLDTFLKMENINSLSVLLKDLKKEYNDILNHIQTYITANLPSKVSSYTSSEEIQTKISELSSKKQEINLELQQLHTLHTSGKMVIVPNGFKPKITCFDLIQREQAIHNEINKLQIPFQGFTTYDINVSDPSKYIKDNFNTCHSKVLQCDLKTNLKQIVDELHNLIVEYDVLEYHLELHCNKKPLTTVSRDDCNTFFHIYDKYHKLYSNHQTPCELNYTYNDVENIKYDETLINNTIEELQNMLNDKSNIKNKDCNLYFNKDCWACRKNMTDNEHILNTIEYLKKTNELKKYSDYLEHKEDIDRYNAMKKEKTSWDLLFKKVDIYEKWLEIKTVADEKIADISKQIAYKQQQLSDAHDFQTKYNDLVHLYNELETLCVDKQYYIERRKTLQIHLDHLNIQEREAYVELSKYQIDNDNCCNYEIIQKKYNCLMEMIINRIDLFNHFVITIKKYKTWIYEDKLLPLVVEKTNKLLSFTYIQRPLELRFKFIENLVYYTIIDEGNEINIEKLSGAQSFAISLSFRLALASIGISKISCNQLFIDEGFCSYDEENLSKVPTIFYNIKKLYSTILFVSHLEDIKTCADKIVHIHRKNGISKICNETT